MPSLPDAVWQRVAQHFGLEIDAAAIEQMTEESRFYSKDQRLGPFLATPGYRRP